MHRRYTDPMVEKLWSPGWTYDAWLRIETETLRSQLQNKVLGDSALPLLSKLEESAGCKDAELEIWKIEQRTQHDVVAFLEWVRSWAGPGGRFLHYGLTSSDLVDTAQGMRFKAIRPHLSGGLIGLQSALNGWALEDTPILGRTHGQVAELQTMRARVWGWIASISSASHDLLATTRKMKVGKLSGPIGTYAHNPPIVEVQVCEAFGLKPHGPGATQIATRQPLAASASSVANFVDAVAKMAHDIRLMNLLGEIGFTPDPGSVASSSMAQKNNPIRAEQLAGMSIMARGYASMLQQQPIWLERDISNSAPERVAVPDLMHILFHTIKLAEQMLDHMYLHQWKISANIERAGIDPLVAEITLKLISSGMSWEDARATALVTAHKPSNPDQAAKRAMSNYPISWSNEDAGR